MPKTAKREPPIPPPGVAKRRRGNRTKPSQVQRAIAEYHALLEETAKLQLPPFDAAEYIRKLRDERG